MFLLIQLIVIVIALISHQHESIATASSIVVQVTKHTDTAYKPLFSALAYFNISSELQQPPGASFLLPKKEQKLLIDLDAPFTWHFSFPRQESCEACPSLLTCRESTCTDLRTIYSYHSPPSCPPPTNTSSYGDFYGCEICPVNVINPVTGSCSQVLPTYDQIMFSLSNGGRVDTLYDLYNTYPTAGSSPPWTFDPFPANVLGVIALSTSAYALPAYLHDPIQRVIALCFPSSSSGVLFFGNGPYYLPPRSDVDIRSYLSYTALIKHPNSFGYFIGVNAVLIKNRFINLPENTTTKISTLEPYTTLRTDVYNNVVRRFSKVTKRIPPAELVAPFGLCFNTTVNGTNVGIKVPNIDLVLQDGKKWTISTTNSIKQVTPEVACLAFVDGGPTSEHAIVVGTYQFENNFVVFNLENSTFGFSSSLLPRQTSCSVEYSSNFKLKG